jgi:hypothetical protein
MVETTYTYEPFGKTTSDVLPERHLPPRFSIGPSRSAPSLFDSTEVQHRDESRESRRGDDYFARVARS